MKKQGQVRVGTCKWQGSTRIDPQVDGFIPIVCLTKSTKYGMLSPYCLTVSMKFQNDPNTYEVLMENAWQFSKVYEKVPPVTETKSRFDRTVIWNWPTQTHLIGNNITMEYLSWRKAGMLVSEPIRYPVGKNYMHKCLFSLKSSNGSINLKMLNYLEARREIYLPLYVEAVKKHPEFIKLKKRLENGENLIILEVDGPHYESLNYYKRTYDVNEDFITENSTILTTQINLEIMLDDTKHRFGHGYCLAGALLDLY